MSEDTVTQEQSQPKVEVANLFMSYAPSIKYIFKDGTVANFVAYRYFTSVPEHVAELQKEIKLGHPSFYINPNEVVVNPAEQDPMSRLRKQILTEYFTALMNKTNPENDLGEFLPTKLTPASTSDIAPVAAGGDATDIKARIASLLATKGMR